MTDNNLVERLCAWGSPVKQRAKPLMREAATELSRLQEALAAAETERDEAKRLLKVQIDGHGLSAKAATANLIRARAAEDKSASLPALLAETRKKALEEARPIIEGLLTAYIEVDEDGLTEHAEPIIAARAFLRSLSNDEAPK